MAEREGTSAIVVRRVAIWPLVAESYRTVFQQARLFVRLGWFWLAMGWLLGLAIELLLSSARHQLIGNLVALPLLIAFAVAWHRATLTADLPAGWRVARFGGRELRYLGTVAVFMGVFFGVLVLGGAGYALLAGGTDMRGLQWVIGIFVLIGIFFASRFILVFPAVAIGDRDMNLARSWRLTRGHAISLFAGLCATCVPLMLFKYAVIGGIYVLAGGIEGSASVIRLILVIPLFLCLDLLGTAASVGFMSYAYEAFTGGVPAGD
jgi:hypothetical protein